MFVYMEVTSNDTIISLSSVGTFLKELENVAGRILSVVIIVFNINLKNVSYVLYNEETDLDQKGKNKKVIELMKDELGGKIMKKFAALRKKTYSYLTDNNDEDKKAKDRKKCVIKRKPKFKDYVRLFRSNSICK